jgi:hypothetical protein
VSLVNESLATQKNAEGYRKAKKADVARWSVGMCGAVSQLVPDCTNPGYNEVFIYDGKLHGCNKLRSTPGLPISA